MQHRAVIIIPARFQSSRFPGKPLCVIAGRSLIQRVWEQCLNAIPSVPVFIATDDSRIASHCVTFGAEVVMTSESCLTGTDRLAEVADKIFADSYINVQGDEPLVEKEDIRKVFEAFVRNPDSVHCGMCSIKSEDEFTSLTVPKVVTRPDNSLLYMSRSPIPGNKTKSFTRGHKQVCIYAFTPSHLKHFSGLEEKTPLEQIEDIELLRFLETGVSVQMVPVSNGSLAVDVPSDVKKVEAEILRRK